MSIVDRLRFDPRRGTVIRTPPGRGYGYWAGGMKVSHDPVSGVFALFYRERTPLERGRGGRCAVAMSTDGIEFDDVWETTKEELASSSIEVGHPVLHEDGEWRLYLSYEREIQRTWRVDVIRASHPSRFEAQGRRTVLEPGHFGMSFIKDPWIVRTDDGGYQMYCAVPSRSEALIESSTITINGDDATVLAESDDGLIFRTLQYVYEAPRDDSWHGHRGRVDSRFQVDGRWLATFSGGRSMYDNYEEPCGLMESPDPHTFGVLETDGPWVESPYGCVRYVYALPVDRSVFFYYENTLPDGSHDMRVSVVDLGPKH